VKGTPSVFGRVDADRVLTKPTEFGDDAMGSDFFAQALHAAHREAAAVHSSGVAAFTGLDEVATFGATGPVSFSGSLINDAAARRAFILGGPASVRRVSR